VERKRNEEEIEPLKCYYSSDDEDSFLEIFYAASAVDAGESEKEGRNLRR
jgi:hypothetical protein